MRDKLVDTVKTVPYPLRIVALVLIFNGMFALIKSATILLGNDIDFDWRIVNMVLGFGLLTKQRIWHFGACISIVASAILHIKSVATAISSYQVFGAGGVLYFLLALTLDLGMLYILLRHQTLKNSSNMKGSS